MHGQPVLHLTQARSLAVTGELRQAIGLLRLTNSELGQYVMKLAQTNANLLVSPSIEPVVGWLSDRPRDAGSSTLSENHAGRAGTVRQRDASDGVSAASGLLGHVMAQVPLLVRAAADRPIAEAFVAGLDPSGWLVCSVSDVARQCGCSIARAEAVLTALQQAEPAGLFSRSLAECLKLQAIELEVLDSTFERLLENLPLLAEGDLEGVARLCGCDTAGVTAMLRIVRGMNPKPGAAFSRDIMPPTEPDVIVLNKNGRWMVELNRSTLPAVEVMDLKAHDDDLRAARWLVRAVSRRNATTLRIARAAVAYQIGFVAEGVSRLRPLTLADLAGQTDLHVSTVSRVTTGLMVALPRATLPLRDFFAATPGSEDGPTSAAIRHEIATLIAAENPMDPLSDQKINAHFARKGIKLARRTIAKYRLNLRIPASGNRRRKARLDRQP